MIRTLVLIIFLCTLSKFAVSGTAEAETDQANETTPEPNQSGTREPETLQTIPKRPRVGNNNSVPLFHRLAAGHVVSPMGPRRFRRFKIWMPWYQAYTRWCFQTRAGRQCKNGDCCLWHMECMIDLREQYTLGFQTNKVRRSEIDENWPDGIFGTGRYQERMAYAAFDHRSMYHRLEVASTRLANVLSQVPDCPCVDDTATLDVTFAFCAQNMPGLKGVVRLPRKAFEFKESADDERKRLTMEFFSKSTMGKLADALTALCSLAIVTSTFVVCRCYYRRSGPLNTTRVPNIMRWRARRQQQVVEVSPPPVPPKKPPMPARKKLTKTNKQKLKAKSKPDVQQKATKDTNLQYDTALPAQMAIDQWRADNCAGNGGLVINRRSRIEWATCPTCNCDFQVRMGTLCKWQKRSDGGQLAVRYFCSNECLRLRLVEG